MWQDPIVEEVRKVRQAHAADPDRDSAELANDAVAAIQSFLAELNS